MTYAYNNKIFNVGMLAGFVLLASVGSIKAQQQTAPSRQQARFLSKLGVDTARARMTIAVQAAYKQQVKAIMSDPALPESTRRAQIEAAVADKNNKLAALLSPAQLYWVSPTTERKRPAEYRPQEAYLQSLLGLDKNKAVLVVNILDTYRQSLQDVTSSGELSEASKRLKVNQLIADKNKKLAAILSPTQLDKLVPERLNGRALANAAPTDPAKVQEIASIRKEFALKARAILADTLLQQQVKDAKVAQMVRERNEKLMKFWGINMNTVKQPGKSGKRK
jgi:hypothetical protein